MSETAILLDEVEAFEVPTTAELDAARTRMMIATKLVSVTTIRLGDYIVRLSPTHTIRYGACGKPDKCTICLEIDDLRKYTEQLEAAEAELRTLVAQAGIKV